MTSRLTITGFVFLFTLISGVWLSRSGRPYSTGIFTIHKLIALGATIALIVAIYHLRQAAGIARLVEIGAMVVTGLLILALFVSGALLSIKDPASDVILVIHRVAPILVGISGCVTLYLLVGTALQGQ